MNHSLPTLLLATALSACSSLLPVPPGDGQLRPCPNRPNCVSSEVGEPRQVPPFPCGTEPELAWRWLRQIIVELGGEIRQEEPGYLHATFTSKFFRFVDDLELRQATEEQVIHVRSAARIGYTDFTVNRKRVERLHLLFQARQTANRETKAGEGRP